MNPNWKNLQFACGTDAVAVLKVGTNTGFVSSVKHNGVVRYKAALNNTNIFSDVNPYYESAEAAAIAIEEALREDAQKILALLT